ncbi:MAG: hypothetical protein O2983_07595 [Planctomycetota bacterium]|nr:hypothetical protein [Planctomycetota bacterium]MDA0918798.1 hypothetical protein [Planctomycetota bacterium]MDA1159459.1 hypothetical protein [Planctomycetota bacterium]
MQIPREASLFGDLKAVFFIGLGLLIVGSFVALDGQAGGGALAIAGSILMGSAVVGNSIHSTLKETENGDGD